MIGRHHPKIRLLRALRRDRGARDAAGVFLAEGLHLAAEALRASASVELAVVSPRLARVEGGDEIRRRLADSRAEILEVTDEILEGIQDARSPQPILLVVRRQPPAIGDLVRGRGGTPLLVIADGVQDPGTLGTMLRSADAAAATGFAVTGAGADLFHPRTVRATMGSLFRLPAAGVALDGMLDAARSSGLTVVGTAARTGTAAHAFDFDRPIALLFGSEGAGVSPEITRTLDAVVHVPMHSGVESLSVSAAAAVLLFEAARQRAERRS